MTKAFTVPEAARAARQASYALAASSAAQRNEALRILSELLREKSGAVFAANAADLKAAEAAGLAAPALARLRFDGHKLEDVCRGAEALSRASAHPEHPMLEETMLFIISTMNSATVCFVPVGSSFAPLASHASTPARRSMMSHVQTMVFVIVKGPT